MEQREANMVSELAAVTGERNRILEDYQNAMISISQIKERESNAESERNQVIELRDIALEGKQTREEIRKEEEVIELSLEE